MLKIAICDDEKYFSEILKTYLEQYLDKEGRTYEIDIYESGEQLLEKKIEIMKYSIIFLDISMDKIDGITTAQKIREYSTEMYIVFVTAYIDYSLEGYKVNAVRYLLKNNINFEACICECMDVIFERMERIILKKTFTFKQGKKEIMLNRLLYVESKLHKLEFYVMEEEIKIYSMYGTLNELENEMKECDFVRIHQSYLVNMKHITKIKDYKATLSDGQKLNIPKVRYREVKNAFITYKGRM